MNMRWCVLCALCALWPIGSAATAESERIGRLLMVDSLPFLMEIQRNWPPVRCASWKTPSTFLMNDQPIAFEAALATVLGR